jgi:hypothetical protein
MIAIIRLTPFQIGQRANHPAAADSDAPGELRPGPKHFPVE